MFLDFSLSEFCTSSAGLLYYIGVGITILKIVIPFIIVLLAILDFGKAVVASKEDEIKTSAKRVLWRVIGGIIIFFIPSIIMFMFGTIAEFSDQKDNFEVCRQCILHPFGDCSKTANDVYKNEKE